jgi:hypothetical protein
MPSLNWRVTLRDLPFIAIGCAGAIVLFQWALGEWATLQLWASWIAAYPLVGAVGPVGAIALLSGLVVGVVVGFFARERSLRVGLWSAFATCILAVGAAVVAGGVNWAAAQWTTLVGPLLAVGLIVGTLVVGRLKRA